MGEGLSAPHNNDKRQVKRCDEMLRKLRFFSDQMHKADIMVSPKGGIPKVSFK